MSLRVSALNGTPLYTILLPMALIATALTGPLLTLLRTRRSHNMYLECPGILTRTSRESKSLQFPPHHGTLGANIALNG
jgi:hypothetical protein